MSLECPPMKGKPPCSKSTYYGENFELMWGLFHFCGVNVLELKATGSIFSSFSCSSTDPMATEAASVVIRTGIVGLKFFTGAEIIWSLGYQIIFVQSRFMQMEYISFVLLRVWRYLKFF